MPNKPDINKTQVGLRVPLELSAAVLRGFSRKGDKADSTAFIRALEEATRNITLTADDLIEIGKKAKQNAAKRNGVSK